MGVDCEVCISITGFFSLGGGSTFRSVTINLLPTDMSQNTSNLV